MKMGVATTKSLECVFAEKKKFQLRNKISARLIGCSWWGY